MDRYGPRIEADLHHEFGLDLLDFFRRKHSWAKLLRLLDQLPGTSKYITAQRDDDEYIEQLVAHGVNLDAKGVMTEDGYGPVESRLDNITDAINALRHVMSERPGQLHATERPVNAIQRYRNRARLKRHHDLQDEVEAARARRRALAG